MKPYGFEVRSDDMTFYRYAARRRVRSVQSYFWCQGYNPSKPVQERYEFSSRWPKDRTGTRYQKKKERQHARKIANDALVEYMLYYHTSNYDPYKGEWVVPEY